MEKSKNSFPVWQIARINLRHNFVWHLVLAIMLVLLTPVLFGTSDLDAQAAAIPLEMFVSLLGIVLLTPVFFPEQNQEIEEIVAAKYVSNILVYTVRIVYSVICLIVVIVLFAAFMQLCRCSVSIKLILGTIATAMFLGSLGMITAALSNNTAVSYMVPMVFFALNFSAGSQLGYFHLFSMMDGEYKQKIWLFVLSAIMIAFSVFVKWILKKGNLP